MSCFEQCRKELGTLADLLKVAGCLPAPAIDPHATIDEIKAIFAGTAKLTHLYVVNKRNVFVGVVSLADILRYSFFYNHDPYSHDASRAQLSLAETAEGFMRKKVAAKEGDDIIDTMEKMGAAGLQEIVVTDDQDRLQALVTLGDLLRYYQEKAVGAEGGSGKR